MTSPTVRPIHDDELMTFMGVAMTAMLGSPPDDDTVESRRKVWDLDRCHGAFDDAGTLCGSARAFATELTVPGGRVDAAAVSAVGVLPTHRRQGHLNRMMQAQLADVSDRGEPLAVLVAAEYPIYGRFGYGPAVEACAIRLDVPGADGWRDPATGSVELVDNATFRETLVEQYDRARQRAPGHITYDAIVWDRVVGEEPGSDGDQDRRRKAPKVLWRDEVGEVQGAAMYSVDDNWVDNRPRGELRTSVLVTTTDEAQRELVRYLSSVDWVTSVSLGLRPIDDPVPLWLDDGRRAVLSDRSDHVWARVVDVPAALSARRYGTSDRLVVEVDDPQGFANGRFALDAGPDGAVCERSTDDADLVVPVDTLGSAYLGGVSWGRLAAAGWVHERREGAVARASAMFTTPRAPWCAMTF